MWLGSEGERDERNRARQWYVWDVLSFKRGVAVAQPFVTTSKPQARCNTLGREDVGHLYSYSCCVCVGKCTDACPLSSAARLLRVRQRGMVEWWNSARQERDSLASLNYGRTLSTRAVRQESEKKKWGLA